LGLTISERNFYKNNTNEELLKKAFDTAEWELTRIGTGGTSYSAPEVEVLLVFS
jgi:hypothetical protein